MRSFPPLRALLLVGGLPLAMVLAAAAESSPPASGPAVPDSPAPAVGRPGPGTSSSLQDAIRDLERMRLPAQPATPRPRTQPAEEPRAPQSVSQERVAPAAQTAPAAAVDPQAVVERLRRHLGAGDVDNPVMLADGLYRQGDRAAAALLYELSLRAEGAEVDKAWSLLQLANCAREADPARARELYRRVTVEHPDSPWARLAETGERLAAWGQELGDILDALPAVTVRGEPVQPVRD